MLIGGVEAGGTKIVCGVAEVRDGAITVLQEVRFPTTTAEEVMPQLISYFRKYPIEALGVASFGPLDLKKSSPTYGCITTTPKEGWQKADWIHPLEEALHVPVALDTDVNGAALGEAIYGAGQGLDVVTYMTVGTGIGVGVYVEGHLLHGMMHPEAGHMRVERHPSDFYKGHCPFHRDTFGTGGCLEGYASGPAIEARWGERGEQLQDKPEVWDMESFYLAQGVANLILCYAPEKIIIGGGVMHQRNLFPMIRENVQKQLHQYVKTYEVAEAMDTYIVPPALGDQSGLIGAVELGRLVASNQCLVARK